MNNCYGVTQKISDPDIFRPLVSLKVFYDGMPKTTGCEKCQEINGENVHWCCLTQSPSMYYVEFLYVWKEALKQEVDERINLILRCIRNYLDSNLNKGCVFYNNGCSCYEQRPFSCRMYGVVPSENWDSRWERIKKEQGDAFNASPQCDLVRADKKISAKEENMWFAHTTECESRLGVSQRCIDLHDEQDGSYRTFHDHVLLELFDEDFLSQITKVRLTKPSQEEINEFVEQIKGMLEQANGTVLSS